ncbi:MAG: hypothetical protein N2691_06090 [Patescibacteria group bacterium]|nr:hypothetical protein [Patescibacteria group bacterium]
MYEKPSSADIARLMVALVLALVAVGSFTYLVVRFGPNPMARRGQVSIFELVGIPTPIPSATPTRAEVAGARAESSTRFKITPVSADSLKQAKRTVDLARIDDQMLVRYNGVVYAPQVGTTMQPVKVTDEERFPWKPVIPAPVNVGGIDEIYSYYASPDMNNLTIVMRWGSNQIDGDTRYAVYVYNEFGGSDKVRLVHTFVERDGQPTVPLAFGMSPSGRYIALSLFSCDDCIGEIPETLIVDSKEGGTRRIGQISLLEWLTGNQFQYKVYQAAECPDTTQATKCAVDPEYLPFKLDQIR